MSTVDVHIENPVHVGQAFGRQSVIFDDLYDNNPIVAYMRERIRAEVLKKVQSGDHLMELNAGTATDAIFFARKGIKVDASDISEGMVIKSNEKIKRHQLEEWITFNQMSFEDLDSKHGTFDHVYSNFGGLNCTPNIGKVLQSILTKLKPGKTATLVIMPPFTIWERLHFFVGKWEVAFRRKFKGRSSKASIEGQPFQCWYYDPYDLVKMVKPQVSEYSITGLCIFVPPSFLQWFPRRLPLIYKFLIVLDSLIFKINPFNRVGDYFILTLTKK